MKVLALPIITLAIFKRQFSTMSVIYKLQKKLGIKLEKHGLMKILALPMIIQAIFKRQSSTMSVIQRQQKKRGIKMRKEGLMEILALPIMTQAIFIRQLSTRSVILKLQKKWGTKLEKEGHMVIFAMLIRASLNLKFSRKNQRINFCFVCYIHTENFTAVEFCHRVTQLAKGFHLQFSGFIQSRFKILESQIFATKNNFCLSGKLISVQLRAGHSFCNK